MPARARPARPRPVRRALMLGAAALLLGCSSPETVDVTLPPPAVQDASVSPANDDALVPALDYALRRLLAGDPAEQFLAGDRLLVVTAETFAEVAADERLLATEISFGGGCPGVCTISVEEVLTALAADLGEPVALAAPVPESLKAWPSVSFRSGDRSWRVSFGADGASLVAVEYFGVTPLL